VEIKPYDIVEIAGESHRRLCITKVDDDCVTYYYENDKHKCEYVITIKVFKDLEMKGFLEITKSNRLPEDLFTL
jgi:hypothetical protein